MNSYVAMDDIITRSILVLWVIGTILTIYFAGRMAERRGRSFENWAWIAGILIGPLAFPLLIVLPKLQRSDPSDPEGERRATDAIGAVNPLRGNPDQGRLNISFSLR